MITLSNNPAPPPGWKRLRLAMMGLIWGVFLVIMIGLLVIDDIVPFLLGSRPLRRTPFLTEVSCIHQLCSKLARYSEKHADSSDGKLAGKSVEGLIAAGILNDVDAVYIRDHHIVFYGFDPKRIGPDIPVLEKTWTNSRPPRVIVGYSDGSASSHELR